MSTASVPFLRHTQRCWRMRGSARCSELSLSCSLRSSVELWYAFVRRCAIEGHAKIDKERGITEGAPSPTDHGAGNGAAGHLAPNTCMTYDERVAQKAADYHRKQEERERAQANGQGSPLHETSDERSRAEHGRRCSTRPASVAQRPMNEHPRHATDEGEESSPRRAPGRPTVRSSVPSGAMICRR